MVERLEPYKKANPNGNWKEWVSKAYYDRVCLSAVGFCKTPDIGYDWEKGEGNLFNYFTYGAACAEVEIDTLTGDHQVIRTDIVMDLGEPILITAFPNLFKYPFQVKASILLSI